jgi:diguanylate cyclase (GGDEF)-like protein
VTTLGAEVPVNDMSDTSVPTAVDERQRAAAADDGAPSGSRPLPGRPRRWRLPPHDDPRDESTIRAFAGGGGLDAENPEGEEALVDPTTDFATRRAWNEAFRREEHRLARYGSRVTLVIIEIDGLGLPDTMLDPGAAGRLIQPLEALLLRNARAADVLARTARWRFAALLPETDDVAAINYVERVRSECDTWLETRGFDVRLAIGWAQATAGGTLSEALRLAEVRMDDDRRRRILPVPPAAAVLLTGDDESLPSMG